MINQINSGSTNEDGSAVIQTVVSIVAPEQIEDKSNAIVFDDVKGIVDRAISSSRTAGRDYVGQCRMAVDAVLAVRPDLSPKDVLTAVLQMRERDALPAIIQTAA